MRTAANDVHPLFASTTLRPSRHPTAKNIQDLAAVAFHRGLGLLAERIRDAGDLLDECVIGGIA